MKEDNGIQNVGATAFELPNSQHPGYRAPIFYGSTSVPHPTNSAAKRADPARVMRESMEA